MSKFWQIGIKSNIGPLRQSFITLEHVFNCRQINGIPFGSFFRLGNKVYQKSKEPAKNPGKYWCLTTGNFEDMDGMIHVWPVDIHVTEYDYDQNDMDNE